MKIILAKTAGFCMGVRRAMEIAIDASRSQKTPVYTEGPLIHNQQAIDLLSTRGIHVVEDDSNPEGGAILLRAHGVPPKTREKWEARGVNLIDATCPHVLLSQKRIQEATAKGQAIIMVGDPGHPEMKCLRGYAGNTVQQIQSVAEAETIPLISPCMVIAQTTFHRQQYEAICAILKKRCGEVIIHDSICNATELRQAEVRKMAERVDALVVVGGKHSANTLRLAEISRECGKPTFHIETADELSPDAFQSISVVGLTAGASTPGWMTQQVYDRIESFSQKTIVETLWHWLRTTARARITTAFGGACLAEAITQTLYARHIQPAIALTITFYVFFAYALNRREPAEPKTRSRVIVDWFAHAHRRILLVTAIASMAGSLLLSAFIGEATLILLGVACLASIFYAVPVFPRAYQYRRLKDIPASKDVFVAVAWTAVIIGTAALNTPNPVSHYVLILAGMATFLLVFAKRVTLDLRDMESDHLIGIETLPIALGRKSAVALMYVLYALTIAFFGVLTVLIHNSTRSISLCMILTPVYGIIALRLLVRSRFRGEVNCQLVMDGMLVFAGVFSFLEGWI